MNDAIDRMNYRDLALQEMGLSPRWQARAAVSSVPANTVGVEPNVRAAAIAAMDWSQLQAVVRDCPDCRLCETRKQTVFGTGPAKARCMMVGEAPGAEEDAQGEPFVGQAGRLLDNMLAAIQLSRVEEVYIANVLKCRPPGNRNPAPDEVLQCEPYLLRQIALVEPKLIVVLGRFAAQSLLQTDASIASLRGKVHSVPFGAQTIPVIVSYHPAYLLRSLGDKAKAWADLCLARATMRQLG